MDSMGELFLKSVKINDSITKKFNNYNEFKY